jgi:hypothetical protein
MACAAAALAFESVHRLRIAPCADSFAGRARYLPCVLHCHSAFYSTVTTNSSVGSGAFGLCSWSVSRPS